MLDRSIQNRCTRSALGALLPSERTAPGAGALRIRFYAAGGFPMRRICRWGDLASVQPRPGAGNEGVSVDTLGQQSEGG
jgi:hypothetical protein